MSSSLNSVIYTVGTWPFLPTYFLYFLGSCPNKYSFHMCSEDIYISLFCPYFSVYHLCLIFNNNLLFWNTVIKKIDGHLNTLASFPLWLLCCLSNLQVIFFLSCLLVLNYLLLSVFIFLAIFWDIILENIPLFQAIFLICLFWGVGGHPISRLFI